MSLHLGELPYVLVGLRVQQAARLEFIKHGQRFVRMVQLKKITNHSLAFGVELQSRVVRDTE